MWLSPFMCTYSLRSETLIPRYLTAGEIFELKAELNSDKKVKKEEAVKKVIASMTVGKDVSLSLCPGRRTTWS
ncbi:AP-2 complex subunit beta [Plecturocebus cupreus]